MVLVTGMQVRVNEVEELDPLVVHGVMVIIQDVTTMVVGRVVHQTWGVVWNVLETHV